MDKVVLLGIIFLVSIISLNSCTTIGNYKAYKDPMCPHCQKFEDLGYQRVFILTNTALLPDDEFMAYAIKRASFYKYTEIRFFWMGLLGCGELLREAVIYYE